MRPTSKDKYMLCRDAESGENEVPYHNNTLVLEDNIPEKCQTCNAVPRRAPAAVRTIKMLTWSGMIALALLGLWHILQHLFGDNIARNDHAWSQCICACNATEAQAAGCIFEEINLRWVQPACYDEELDHEFSHSGPGPAGQWTYYVEDEQDNRVALSASDISTLSQPLVSIWYSHERHIAHCVFQWRKLLQQQQQQQQSISSSLSVELQAHRERHIAHCTHAFLQRTDPEAITTNVVKNASACMGEL